jgi:membrane-associated phospholipid phosphatase
MAAPKCRWLLTFRAVVLAASVAGVARAAAAQDVGAGSNPPPPPDQTSQQAPPQQPQEAKPIDKAAEKHRSFPVALVHNLGDDVKHLPRRNSLFFALGGGAAAWAIHPLDDDINSHLLGSSTADNIYRPGKYIGSTQVQIGASIATYLIGRAANKPRAVHIGMDMLEAQILTEGIVEGLKVIVRRPRPTNPDGTPSAAGFSFPSGHAAITFATATVFQQHFGWKAAIPTYAVATYVATSRLHDNRHWASDVVFGATTGIIVGRSVTWHGRNDFHLAMFPVPGGLGGIVTW